jgi:hypothetical protein
LALQTGIFFALASLARFRRRRTYMMMDITEYASAARSPHGVVVPRWVLSMPIT